MSNNTDLRTAIQELITRINSNESKLRTTLGSSTDHMGSFTGITIDADLNVKDSLQALENESELVRSALGVSPKDNSNMGTFTSGTLLSLQSGLSAKQHLQTLATQLDEEMGHTDNLQSCVGTSSSTCPTSHNLLTASSSSATISLCLAHSKMWQKALI